MNPLSWLLGLLLSTACLLAHPSAAQTPVGLGWARNNVNGAVFRKNSVVTHKREQYTAYYDSLGYVLLAKRRLPAGAWQVQRTKYKGKVQDAHNVISLMVDGRGYLHLSFDHHGNPLRYCRSTKPGGLALTELLPMTGQQEQNVTYPEFHRFPNGDLLFVYRDGSSGNGNLVLNRYSPATQTWSRLHSVLIDGEGKRNAYWQACIDGKGTIHVSWVWRESPDVASNHDIAYARSLDGGKTWQKSTGAPYQLPITEATAEYAARIPQNSELINQTSITTDAAGTPYIATYWRPAGTQVPQYQLIYLAGKEWKTAQISQRITPFSLSGAGTKKIPISRPQLLVKTQAGKTAAYMLFRDVERQDRVSVAQCADLRTGDWTVTDLTSSSVGNWEPSYDTEQWQQHAQLHLFVQRTGQGDGERLEPLSAQPVYILEWKPGTSPKPAAATVPGARPQAKAKPEAEWKLVWADEFNIDGRPDPQNWQYETGFVRNHELQWYQPDNARCENGLLVLEARREQRPNPTYEAGSPHWQNTRPTIEYTSASLNTRDLHAWQFGRFEMRGRINTSSGLWPAFWTLGVAGQWPSGGEIDIMEFYQGKVLANVASGTAQPNTPKWDSETKPIAVFNDPDWANKFHVWRMDWDAEAIRLYLDDQLLNETPLTQTVNQDGTGINPMLQPHYILLNLAMGGENGGPLTGTVFPNRFEVDYVRVYQR
ncbi:BNR-4 repeat-containing protein [Hymenobacter fodinae]|uniref:BNR-4 repeat-containing protein n=1 Tax=Hymenobacter fodinae TaxID=2510796 RepID=UPI001AEC5038|nr:BNR-4 repeat-containing protein [Hymenobacter fodinae]